MEAGFQRSSSPAGDAYEVDADTPEVNTLLFDYVSVSKVAAILVE